MLQRFLFIALTLCSLTASAQWQQTGSKVRYVNGLGIPTRDTVAGVAADSSQIVIRPADSSLYIKYKRTWLRVGGAGFSGSGTTNYIPKFTSSTAIGNSSIFDNGNVGIGTTSPVGRLHLLGAGTEMRVESNTTTDGFIRYINTSGSMSFGMSGAPTNTMLLYDRTNNHNAYEYLGGASGRHVWYTANTERMRITSGGNALIGTATDNGTDRLQVSGSMNVSTLATTNNLSVTTNATVGGTLRVTGSTTLGTTITGAITASSIDAASGNATFGNIYSNGIVQMLGVNVKYRNISATYTATTSDDYFINITSGTFTLNLPTAATPFGQVYVIKNSGTGTVTVDPNGTQTIDGATTFAINVQNQSITIIGDGSNWKIVSKYL